MHVHKNNIEDLKLCDYTGFLKCCILLVNNKKPDKGAEEDLAVRIGMLGWFISHAWHVASGSPGLAKLRTEGGW